jgi:hypothetical protein
VCPPGGGWYIELKVQPLILSFSLWEKEPSNYPQRDFWRPLSQRERDRVRGCTLNKGHCFEINARTH